jgi:hypothetical protein
MKFNPGQNKIRRGGTTYIKDAVQTQVDPPKEEVQPKEEINQPKKETDESVQHEQVVQKPISKGSKPVRKQRQT